MSCPDTFAWRPTTAPDVSGRGLPGRGRYDDIWCGDADECWAVNQRQEILHTVDGGDSWEQQRIDLGSCPQNHILRCICFAPDKLRGWLGMTTTELSWDLSNPPPPRLFSTSDGGKNWVPVPALRDHPLSICGLWPVTDQGETTVWAVGSNVPSQGAVIMRSERNGATWSAVDMWQYADSLVDVLFVTPEVGLVVGGITARTEPTHRPRGPWVGYRMLRPVILRTTDGGATWTDVTPGDLSRVTAWGWKIQRIPSSNRIFVSTQSFRNDLIAWSDDDGETWDAQEIGLTLELEGIGFVSNDCGWVGGWGKSSPDTRDEKGTTVGTEDGGSSWADVSPDVGWCINRFRFVWDEAGELIVGYAAGEDIYKYEPRAGVTEGTQEVGDAEAVRAVGPIRWYSYPSSEDPDSTRLVSVSLQADADVAERPDGGFTLRVFSRWGQQVRVLEADHLPIVWDSHDAQGRLVQPGHYMLRLTAEGLDESGTVFAGRPTE